MLTKVLIDSIKKKVLVLKGDKTYENFASEIRAKTGQNHPFYLQHNTMYGNFTRLFINLISNMHKTKKAYPMRGRLNKPGS